jgi:transcriptional regulator with XRE-family HTH domain
MDDPDFLSLFGARCKELRLEREWDQKRAAARIGCSPGYYCKIENGDQGPTLEFLPKISRGFGVDELDLLCFPQTAERHLIADLLRVAPAEVRQRTLEFVRAEMARHLGGDAPEQEHHPRQSSQSRRASR